MNGWSFLFLVVSLLELFFLLWLAVDQRTKLWASWVFYLLYPFARKQKVWFVMADINDLKAVNDRYGHEVGDQVLFSVAQALRRAPGMWFRLGGDEFVGFVSGKIPERQMGILVDSICQQVQKGEITSSPMAGNGFEKIVPQIAIGFARGMRKADANMYKDKGGKKNGK